MKALRFLGIALLACSMMFVSCKKDEPKPDDSTAQQQQGGGDNPGGGGGQTVTEKITVNFDGETWEPGFINQNYYYDYQGTPLCLYDNWIEEGNYYPSTDGYIVLDASADQPYQMNYYKETGYTLNTTDGGQVQVGDWAWLNSNYNDPKTVTNVAFDANTLVASFKVVAPMIDIYEYFGNNQNVVVKNLTVQYQNVTLSPYQATKGLNTVKIGTVTGIAKAGK